MDSASASASAADVADHPSAGVGDEEEEEAMDLSEQEQEHDQEEAGDSPELVAGGGAGEGRQRPSFQKLWTEADEMAILEGFLEFVTARGTTHADYQHGTAPFFEAVKGRLSSPFSTNQLVEKLRRLKRKYRNTAARIAGGSGAGSGGRRRRAFSFRSAHDEATYEISRKIWSPTFKRGQLGRASNQAASKSDLGDLIGLPGGSKSNLCAPPPIGLLDASKSNLEALICLPDAPQSNLGNAISIPDVSKSNLGAALGLPNAQKSNLDASNGHPSAQKSNLGMPGKAEEEEKKNRLSPAATFAAEDPLWPVPEASAAVSKRMERKWREQRILELEVFLKRVELVREGVVARLEELRSMHAAAAATADPGNAGAS